MSKSKLREATYSIHQLVKTSSQASEKTKADTRIILVKSIKDLHALGYKVAHINGLKPKHIEALVGHWQSAGKSVATVKNYLAKLRLAASLVGKENIVKPNNADYGLPERQYISQVNKAITQIDTTQITDKHLQYSLKVQQFFGLRREESLKLIVSQADKGEHLELKGSWTKGNVPRLIPIVNNEQRTLLKELHHFIGDGKSLIPEGLSNKQQINRYINLTKEAGFKRLHGLRHHYAQNRYKELTDSLSQGRGWECPFVSSKPTNKLERWQKDIDKKARMLISHELGHSRLGITKIYLG